MNIFKSIIRTLFSNITCIEMSCTKSIITNIIPVLFALISIFLISLPSIIQINNTNGSDWINHQFIYNFDDGIISFIEECKKEKIKINFKKKKLILETDKAENEINNESFFKKREFFLEKKQDPNIKDSKKNKYLSIFFTEKIDNDYQNFCEDKKNNLNSSIIIFGSNQIHCYFFDHKEQKYKSELIGDYENIKIKNLEDLFCQKENGTYDKKETMNKWKSFFDNTYINTRKKQIKNEIIYNVLIVTSIILLLGLITWFLSHTKNNLYRIHNFWTSQKIAFYMSFAPSLISFLIGLILNQTIMIFIIALLLRLQFINKIFKQNKDD